MSVAWSQAPFVSKGRNGPLGRLQGQVWAEARTEHVIVQRVHKAHFVFVDGMYAPDASRLFSFLPFVFVDVSTFFLPFSLFLSLSIFSSCLARYEFPSLRRGVSLWVAETLRGRFEAAFSTLEAWNSEKPPEEKES